MSNRYTDLEDELSMSMKMDSNAQYHELHASRRSPREGMTMATSLRNTRYQQRGMSPRSFVNRWQITGIGHFQLFQPIVWISSMYHNLT